MRKVFFDCDPGHDDIMAILSALAHPQELCILGFTTAAGNNLLENVTENLLKTLTYLGCTDLPVASGAAGPLIYNPEPQAAHGVSGLDGFDFPPARMTVSSTEAASYLHGRIMAQNEPVTLIAMAPLTNIALLLKTYPGLKDRIRDIIIMGGSIYSGNIVARGEFNIYADPHAADMVMRSGCRITLCPLEVCADCAIEEKDILQMRQWNGHVTRMTAQLLDFYAGYSRRHHQPLIPVFDLSTVMYLLHPEMFRKRRYSCRIVLSGADTRGMTVLDPQEDGPVEVLTGADRKQFVSCFLADLRKLDLEYEADQYKNRQNTI